MNTKLFSTLFFSTALFGMSAFCADDILQVPESLGKVAEIGESTVKKVEDATKAIEKTTDASGLPDLASLPALPGGEQDAKKKKDSENTVSATDGEAPMSVMPPTIMPEPQAASSAPDKKEEAAIAPTPAVQEAKTPTIPQGMMPPVPVNNPDFLPSPSTMALPNPQGAPVIPDEATAAPSGETPPQPTNTDAVVNVGNASAVAQNAASAETPKVVQRKKHRKIAHAKPRYKNILPETIYAKKYQKINKHLPIARYEQEMDAQVFLAIAKNDINGLRAMLDYGKRNINKPNVKGDTPLIAAVKYNAINCVRLLLGRKADATAKDAHGLTALEHAQQQGSYKIVRALTIMTQEQKMANAEVVSNSRYRPLVLMDKQ